MSGHSKWAQIKRKKAKTDSARGRIFSKLIKEITIVARMGGGDPGTNPRLRQVIETSKSENMPNATIEKAIKRGTGELPGVNYEEVTYEGYGPGGIALYMEVVTDNKNRTVAELRYLLSKNDGHMGESGSVAWMFDKKGQIVIEKGGWTEEDIMMAVLDAGAEDIADEGDSFSVTTPVDKLESVKSGLQENDIPFASSELTMLPQNMIELEGKDAEKALKLLNYLEEHDDIQHVYTNLDIDEKLMETIITG